MKSLRHPLPKVSFYTRVAQNRRISPKKPSPLPQKLVIIVVTLWAIHWRFLASFTRCRTKKSYIILKKISPKNSHWFVFSTAKTPAVLALTTAASAAAASAWFEVDVEWGILPEIQGRGQTQVTEVICLTRMYSQFESISMKICGWTPFLCLIFQK